MKYIFLIVILTGCSLASKEIDNTSPISEGSCFTQDEVSYVVKKVKKHFLIVQQESLNKENKPLKFIEKTNLYDFNPSDCLSDLKKNHEDYLKYNINNTEINGKFFVGQCVYLSPNIYKITAINSSHYALVDNLKNSNKFYYKNKYFLEKQARSSDCLTKQELEDKIL